jgi:class 3 adenylate cyclase
MIPEWSEEIVRAVSAFVRTELQAPVARLSAMIEILAEDAAHAGLTRYEQDLLTMRAAGARLLELVSTMLERTNDGGEAGPSAMEIRHDLRTPITAILGYGELMAEEAQDRGDTQLLEPLAHALDAASRLLREIDQIVEFSIGGESAGPRTVIPEVLRKAVEGVHQLSRHEPLTKASVVGRILVVDDNHSMRELVARRLVREGHRASTCGSGQAALDRTAEGSFDLLLLDLMMPGLHGLEVLKRLKARASTRAMPVIVISALDQIDAAIRCIEAGADDFLSKPLNETLLRARIGSSLERKFLRDREEDAVRRLRLEQERSEMLLRNVLPVGVVQRLRRGEAVVADHFDEVTVLFCDLVGFTALSARLEPARTLDLLNEIFSGFDRLAEENGLEKIKTIGDAYMAVGGMPDPVKDHATRVVTMACGMPDVLASAGNGKTLGMRIGIDTGPAVAGIIGKHKFFYDVWGDTVNTASRLEGACEPGRIHVSSATRDATGGQFSFEERGPIDIRGKGLMSTFYVSLPPEGMPCSDRRAGDGFADGVRPELS